MIANLIIIYLIGFTLSWRFMFKFFSRDMLSDFAFKCHITFLSSIWFFFYPIMFMVLVVAPIVCCSIGWVGFMIIQPKSTWRDTKEMIAEFKAWIKTKFA